jgi:hypothetical protein
MAHKSIDDLAKCGETLVLKNLAFTCQLTHAHDGVHRCRADDQGTQVVWPVPTQTGVNEKPTERRTLRVN